MTLPGGALYLLKDEPASNKKLTVCRPADISPALFLTVVQLFNNWRVGMVVTDDLASADLQPPWWRGPVGSHDDVIKWKTFLRYWSYVRGIHRSPANFPHKGQWRGVLMFSLICAWINTWVNNRDAGDSRWHHAHHDVVVMISGPNAGVAQREYWEWRLTFSFRYNVVLATLCKLTNHQQIWLNSLKFSDAYASIK